MDKCIYFLVNIFCNSLLTFFTTSGLIALILLLFRIRPSRLSSFLWMIPLYKLPFDLCYYNFTTWSYLHGIDPTSCPAGTRNLTIGLQCLTDAIFPFLHISSKIQLDVPPNFTFTFADLLALKIPLSILYLCMPIIFFLSCYFVYKMIKNTPRKKPSGHTKKISHQELSSYCKKHDIQVISTEDPSPYSYGVFAHTICIPSSPLLSEEEYCAILAHEVEHCRYKDTLSRYLLCVIATFFWWIPTKWLRKKIEIEQELSCDSACQRHKIDPIHLASALYIFAKANKSSFACSLTEHVVSKRIQLLLSPQLKKSSKVFAMIAIALSFFTIFLGKFWIF